MNQSIMCNVPPKFYKLCRLCLASIGDCELSESTVAFGDQQQQQQQQQKKKPGEGEGKRSKSNKRRSGNAKDSSNANSSNNTNNNSSSNNSNSANSNNTISSNNSNPAAAAGATTSGSNTAASEVAKSSSEIRKLLRRKDELERKQKMQEKYTQRLQDILSQSTIALNIEVHPRYLVPDTNCFVDYLRDLESIARAHPLYQLMVPIVVINELEGLSKGIKPVVSNSTTGIITSKLTSSVSVFPSKQPGAAAGTGSSTFSVDRRFDPEHAEKVADASKKALHFIKQKNPALRCVTTKGSILNTSAFTFEDDVGEQKSNDDRILETALNLCRNHVEEKRGEVRYIKREVVLLTTDRNLRVKALSNDLPVRELPDFIKWSGLGSVV